MISLSNIPEPSNNAPQVQDVEDVAYPLASNAMQRDDTIHGRITTQTQPSEDSDQQVDCFAVLLVLMIAAVLLRFVLGMLGPMQGIDIALIEFAQQQGKDILAGKPATAYPLFDLLAYGIASIGVPAWSVVVLGSLLTLASIPAAFVIGKTLTGRSAAGIIAGALIAVHPAVLTASNQYASHAIALGLVTLGLAALCLVEQKKSTAVLVGATLLGLAGLAAPVCWVVGVLAGPVVYKLARKDQSVRAFGYALLVVVLASTPTALYRASLIGTKAKSLLTEWNQQNAPDQLPGPTDRLLVTMTHPSFKELGQALHLPVSDAGRLKVIYGAAPPAQAERDIVADTLADGWLLMNAGLAGLAAISVGVMLARRRLAETLLLAVPLAALAFSTLPPSEALRLPMIAMVGVLATGLLATRCVHHVDEAAKEAKRLKKLAKREEKERKRQQRELEKHKDALASFDVPDRRKHQRRKIEPVTTQADQPFAEPATDDAPPITARPI